MVKVISLSNESYDRLRAIKGNRSFSEVVIEFTNTKNKNILDFAGVFADNNKFWANMRKKIYEDRKKAKLIIISLLF